MNELSSKKRIKVSLNVPASLLDEVDSLCVRSGCSRTSAMLYFIYKGVEIENEFLRTVGQKRSRKIDKLMSESIEKSTMRANNSSLVRKY